MSAACRKDKDALDGLDIIPAWVRHHPMSVDATTAADLLLLLLLARKTRMHLMAWTSFQHSRHCNWHA
jgi:hypothetical protein